MSRGKNLQEMEVGTAQSKTAVNAGAKPAEAMDTSIAGSYEDLLLQRTTKPTMIQQS